MQNIMVHGFTLFILTAFTSAAGAWLIARYGQNFGLMDEPIYRSSHRTIKPKGGGIGILIALIIAAIQLELPVGFWVPAALLSFLSLMSDGFRISVLFRLLIQFGTSIVFLMTIWQTHPFSSSGLLVAVFISIYMVATTNYYNFMDGINGMAGICGIIGFGLLAVYGTLMDAPLNFIILAICMMFCCLGFLPLIFPGHMYLWEMSAVFCWDLCFPHWLYGYLTVSWN